MSSGLLLLVAIVEAIARGCMEDVSLVRAECNTAASHLTRLCDTSHVHQDWRLFPASRMLRQGAKKNALQSCAVANKVVHPHLPWVIISCNTLVFHRSPGGFAWLGRQ